MEMTLDEIKEILSKDDSSAEGIQVINELVSKAETLEKDVGYFTQALKEKEEEQQQLQEKYKGVDEKMSALRKTNQELLSKITIVRTEESSSKKADTSFDPSGFFKAKRRKILV